MAQCIDILIIRGAPGIGKSTIGELLRPFALNGAIVDIDDMRNMVNNEKFIFNDNYDYVNAVKASCVLVESFLQLGYAPIVVVDVFSLGILELFTDHFGMRKLASITLYASDDILCRRMESRPTGYINLEVARSVNRHIYQTMDKTDACIDTSLLSPLDVLNEVRRIVDSI